MPTQTIMNTKQIPASAGTVYQEVPDTEPSNLGLYYDFSVANGDFVSNRTSSNGQVFTEISIDPFSSTETQTIVEFKKPFRLPLYAEIEASLSQRTKGDYAVMEITDKDTSIVDSPTEYSITSCSQSATTLTISIDSAFDGYLGSWVDVYGLADNRFNYTNLAVATISSDKKTLTFTTSDEATITSLTATPASLTGGKLKRQAKLLQASNAIAMRFTGTSATSSAYVARFGGGSIKELGTVGGSRLSTSASTAATYTSGATGQVELKATSRFRIELEPETIAFLDRGIDVSSTNATRGFFTAVKPKTENDYYVRFRAVSPMSTTIPVARIVSATKTASTTTVIVTDGNHNLSNTSYVTIKGVRDQTNFANTTTPTVVTVISPTSFSIVHGSSATATSYGGAVILCNGQVDQQGAIAQTIQSVARDANGLVTLVGSASWSGYGGVGEYVNVYGARDNTTGADLGFDGVYRVHNVSTTTMLLEPVAAINGLGQAVTPTGGVVATTNCGGLVILRTTLRSHDFVLATYNQQITKIFGQGTSRPDLSFPVNITSSSTLTANANTTETALIASSIGTLTTAATTNATSLKTTAGTVYSVTVSNTSASAIYLKLYNKASAPTVGTDVPLITIPVAATSFVTFELGRVGTRFATGIAYAVTGAMATADTTVITAGSLITISYI